MLDRASLKVMSCPTCGGSLNVENNNEIVCVYCGNTIIPVKEAAPAPAPAPVGEAAPVIGGTIRVEGIKTSSSALAYIEEFFEEYDWDVFAYSQTLSIGEIDKLSASLKSSSADDKNTWIACFKAASVPYLHKIKGCQQILNSVISEYKKESLEAYSRFDAYKRISSMILSSKKSIVANLEKYAEKAGKYGADSVEVADLTAEIEHISSAASLETYRNIESIPEIRAFIEEKNTRIAYELESEGINAVEEYARARSLIEEKRFAEALSVLISLKGYSDTADLIKKVDKYFLISDVLEIDGTLYYFMNSTDKNEEGLNLHPTVDGKIAEKPIIKNIKQIITNYADILYYLDTGNKLKRYNLATHTEDKIYEKALYNTSFYVYNRRIFIFVGGSNEAGLGKGELLELNVETGEVRTVIDCVKKVLSLNGNMMIYSVSEKTGSTDPSEPAYKLLTNIINLDSFEITELGCKKLTIEGFVKNYVVYTQNSPNSYNKNLYIKELGTSEPEKLIEQNIFEFFKIISGRLFYYIGNSKNKTLVHVSCDGNDRREWPLYITDVHFEQGGWLYFTRKSGYNAILCKSRLDGTRFSIIASDIEEFIEIKNGYLYYIDYNSTLVKIRMDGSNKQKLCDDVENVLAVKDNKIIFVSLDDRIKVSDGVQLGSKAVKSIYAVDFSGSGKIKLAYNVKNAKSYDDNTVYFVAAEQIKSSYDKLEVSVDVLYSLDVETNRIEKLMDIEIKKEKHTNIGFIVAMIIMTISFLLALIGSSEGSPALAAIGTLCGIISLIVGLVKKFGKK